MIPVLEYDATTSGIGKKMLPEPPAEVPPLLKPSTIQALEGIIGLKFKRRYYLVHVLVRRSASVVKAPALNAAARQANRTLSQN